MDICRGGINQTIFWVQSVSGFSARFIFVCGLNNLSYWYYGITRYLKYGNPFHNDERPYFTEIKTGHMT